jgi:hypothetical protein
VAAHRQPVGGFADGIGDGLDHCRRQQFADFGGEQSAIPCRQRAVAVLQGEFAGALDDLGDAF